MQPRLPALVVSGAPKLLMLYTGQVLARRHYYSAQLNRQSKASNVEQELALAPFWIQDLVASNRQRVDAMQPTLLSTSFY
jgi:hypothetical protein